VNKFPSKSIILTSSLVFSSCSATQPLPALLEKPSAETRLLLEIAVGDLFDSQSIKLADNTFLEKSIVIIEYSQPKDNRGNLLDGREIREADTVSLLTVNGKCYVRHNQSGQIKIVTKINCNKQ
jgi:hypothetical protein